MELEIRLLGHLVVALVAVVEACLVADHLVANRCRCCQVGTDLADLGRIAVDKTSLRGNVVVRRFEVSRN